MYNFIQNLFKIGVAGLSFKRESFKFPNASLLHFVHCRLWKISAGVWLTLNGAPQAKSTSFKDLQFCTVIFYGQNILILSNIPIQVLTWFRWSWWFSNIHYSPRCRKYFEGYVMDGGTAYFCRPKQIVMPWLILNLQY
jgi:hypothetical protein